MKVNRWGKELNIFCTCFSAMPKSGSYFEYQAGGKEEEKKKKEREKKEGKEGKKRREL